MQEETNEKTIALYIKTGKLTAQQLQKAMKALLAQMKKQHDKQKIPHGKQTLKQLMKQNAGVSNIEITKDNIKAFESTAKKYGIDFALKKDSTETPPRYLVFFKGRDADALTAAFKEFSAKKLTQEQKPSIHFITYLFAAFLASRPRRFYRFSKCFEVIFFYWSFCHIYSPSYILLFTFCFGYAYTVHIISLNNSYYAMNKKK